MKEEPAVRGVINMTDEVLRLRGNRGKEMYHAMDVIFEGSITGVQVKFMSGIRREDRRTFIGTSNAFQDAEAELRLTEQLGEEGRRPAASIGRGHDEADGAGNGRNDDTRM